MSIRKILEMFVAENSGDVEFIRVIKFKFKAPIFLVY